MTKKDSNTPELDALLKHQAEINVAQQQLDALQGFIAKQETAQAALREQIPALAALEQQREALLAEVAIGAADSADLDELNQKITGAEAQKAEIEPAIIRCQQTIAGLQRKVADQSKALEVLRARIPRLVREYLLAEANLLALQYLEKAKALIADVQRLEGITLVLQEVGHLPFMRPHGAMINLPAYGLPAFEGKHLWQLPGLIYNDDQISHHRRRAMAQTESERIRALGIEFDKFE